MGGGLRKWVRNRNSLAEREGIGRFELLPKRVIDIALAGEGARHSFASGGGGGWLVRGTSGVGWGL